MDAAKTVEQWSLESYDVVKTFAYKDIKQNVALPEAYLKQGDLICRKRMALAGYRLADMIMDIYSQHKTDMLKLSRNPLDVNW
jgi:S1/P1 Nuclease